HHTGRQGSRDCGRLLIAGPVTTVERRARSHRNAGSQKWHLNLPPGVDSCPVYLLVQALGSLFELPYVEDTLMVDPPFLELFAVGTQLQQRLSQLCSGAIKKLQLPLFGIAV